MTFSERAVEAAAKAICLEQFGNEIVHGEARCCQAGGTEGCCIEAVREQAEKALTAALAVDGLALQGWRTIDSAPKDGTEVLLWFPFTPDKPHWSHPAGFVFLAKWWISDGIDEDRWVDPDDCEDLGSTPTHWQPLPSPPLTAASDGEVG